MSTHNIPFLNIKKITLNYSTSAAIGFFQETQERVRNSRGKRDISVRATEVLLYRARKVLNIGGEGARFRIVGGGGGGQGGGPRPRPQSVPNNYISYILTLKTDNIAKLRIELKSILLEIPSNKIKGTYIKLVLL